MDTVLITLDIDWAPDFIIDWVADLLITHEIKATWFVTHSSPAIDRLKSRSELFELGIHPNFLPGTTQGKTPQEILNFCLGIVPDAQAIRTHGLFQSSPLLAEIINETNLKIDLSLFLPYHNNLSLFEYWWNKKKLIRIPYYWEDDFEMERPNPNWRLSKMLYDNSGLKIFNFHPVHIYLNSYNMEKYDQLKSKHHQLSNLKPEWAEPYIQYKEGTQTLFKDLIEYLSYQQKSLSIQELL